MLRSVAALAGGARFAQLAGMRGCGDFDRSENRFGNDDRSTTTLQDFEARDHRAVLLLAFAFAAGGLDGTENAAQDIHEREQAADDVRVGRKLTLAQQAKKVLAGVGKGLEAAKAEKTGCAFDGMHGAEDFREQLLVGGACFEVGQTPLHAVQAFLAFEQEFTSKVVHELVIGRRGRNLSGRGTSWLDLR